MSDNYSSPIYTEESCIRHFIVLNNALDASKVLKNGFTSRLTVLTNFSRPVRNVTLNVLPRQGLLRLRKRRLSDSWLPYNVQQQDDFPIETMDNLIHTREKGERKNRLIKLAEGIEIYEDQLRSVKWNDYRKLTRGLATILFSPAELATCSVTGQRWSRAGSGERPVKPALDRSKVQAIISYVATRFPMIEISRIKQVLAYKCKENSTAFKMKAVRYYEDQHSK